MLERRLEPRMLCADLVDVEWTEKSGAPHQTTANLEDISLNGACIQAERPIPLNARIKIAHGKAELAGKVRYCVYREIGYFIGVEFAPESKWTSRSFRPRHLFDPRRLVHPA